TLVEDISATSAGSVGGETAAGSTLGSPPGWPRAGGRTSGTRPVSIPPGRPLGRPKEARTPMSDTRLNKYRAAIDARQRAPELLLRGRDFLVEEPADEIIHQADALIDGGFAFNEFLEGQGPRLHFLCLLVSQLEQSAEALDESMAPPPPPPAIKAPRKRRTRS